MTKQRFFKSTPVFFIVFMFLGVIAHPARSLAAPNLEAPSPAPSFAAPSFDCKKATTDVETAICTTPDLAQRDAKLSAAFQQAYHHYGATERKNLLVDQRLWLAQRASCKDPPQAMDSCLKERYDGRLAALRQLIATPEKALKSLLWTTGVVCDGNRALVRFAHVADDLLGNAPPDVGGSLATAQPAASSCRLADGRVVKFKTASARDEAAYGDCGAESSEIYSVWIGDAKVISREQRAGKCDTDSVRAIYFDGTHLSTCDEQRSRWSEPASPNPCRDMSVRLRKPIDDPLIGQFVVTPAAASDRAFCESLVRDSKSDDPDYPAKTVDPEQPITGDAETSAAHVDLNNTGTAKQVFVAQDNSRMFDADIWVIPPAGTDRKAVQATLDKLRSDGFDPAKLRQSGWQVFAGDQTPYKEPSATHLTPFIKNGQVWLLAQWAIFDLSRPTYVVLRPMPDGSQKRICQYQAIPNL